MILEARKSISIKKNEKKEKRKKKGEKKEKIIKL